MIVSNSHPLIGIPTWNDGSLQYQGVQLYGMNQSYVDVLRNGGALPILIPLNMGRKMLRSMFERLDGLFLAGGNDISPHLYEKDGQHEKDVQAPAEQVDSTDIARDSTELTLACWALDAGMPLFGVCRGMQLINVACGGTLYRDLHRQRPDLNRHDYVGTQYKRDQVRHHVTFTQNSELYNIFGSRTGVNSMHHQGINSLGNGLRVTAMSTDSLPEAIESINGAYVMGTQWHPEELVKKDRRHTVLIDHFIRAAAADW